MTEHTSRNSIPVSQREIEFNVLKPGIDLGGTASNVLYTDESTQAAAESAINAVDIDWDEANIDAKVQSLITNPESITEGICPESINTTGDLLYTIANLQAQVTVLTNLVWNAPNDVVLKTFLNGKANIGI